MDASPVQTLCKGGCGFYGSPATDDLCSLCYKKNQKQSPTTPSAKPTTPVHRTSRPAPATSAPTAEPVPKKVKVSKDERESAIALTSTSTENSEDNSDEKGSDKGGKKRKNRCNSCRRKVGLTGFECRCGGLFCSMHRYSDEHDCKFDYKGMAAEEIRRQNPVIVGEKVQKI